MVDFSKAPLWNQRYFVNIKPFSTFSVREDFVWLADFKEWRFSLWHEFLKENGWV